MLLSVQVIGGVLTEFNYFDPALLEVYSSWADELRTRYQRVSKLFKHGFAIGRSREAYIADTLRRCLPSYLKVSHGVFYSPGIGASREQDVLIIDSRKLGPIEEVGDFGIYYRDSVRACIEVKSILNKKELKKGLDLLTESRMEGPGGNAKYVLFAYESSLTAKGLLDAIENTENFFDNRPTLIVVLGSLVVVTSRLHPKKPRPWFELTAYSPRQSSPDLTLLELLDTVMSLDTQTPIEPLHKEIRHHFEAVATRKFVCPVERPGTGLGTNLF